MAVLTVCVSASILLFYDVLGSDKHAEYATLLMHTKESRRSIFAIRELPKCFISV
jgi:hypothetical protein